MASRDDDLMRPVLLIFAEEVKEQAQAIGDALLAMEADPSSVAKRIEELFRQAHSMKGSASSLGVKDVERLAHELESALTPVRRQQAGLERAVVDACLAALDAVRLRAEGIRADGEGGRAEVAAATARLAELSGHAGAEPAAPAQAAAAEPVSQPPPAADDAATVRVQAARLSALERVLDDARALRGRLDHRAASCGSLLRALEKLWLELRTEVRLSGTLGRGPLSADALYLLVRQVAALRHELVDDAEREQASALELDENLREMRLVPAAGLRETLQRAAREAAQLAGREVQLVFSGSDVQIDRRVLEELKNPLLHLVRNAVDHGVEPPSVREAVGKPARARVEVSIGQRGGELEVRVADDGRGLDLEAVRARAIEREMVSAEEAAGLDDQSLAELLFRPGFSTARTVTALSGRGVGLDVVRAAAARLHGRVDAEGEPGRGATFTVTVPLTVAAFAALVVEEADRPFALPLSAVERIARVRAEELEARGSRLYVRVDGEELPALRLARAVGLTERVAGAWLPLVVLRGARGPLALACEKLSGQRDLVLRPLPPELERMALLSSAAILPDGQVLLVLSPRALTDQVERAGAPSLRPPRPRRILVADDSITTRTLLRRVLETAGYEVRAAADGEEALRIALAEPFDLVVSDIRMPLLDGLKLTARLKADPRTARLPVVLFSSLDSEEDKRRGAASGASAYLTKGAFDRGTLVDVVMRLAEGRS
jgi:two-component system chemotaxis sensor kinase CheA